VLARIGGTEVITGNWSYNNPIVGAEPTLSTHLATKAYVDAIASNVSPQLHVRAATTADIFLNGLQTIDTVVLIAGDRVLVKDQLLASENGIYVVAAGAWSRATNYDGSEVSAGDLIFVAEGSANINTSFVLLTPDPITVGLDDLTFGIFTRTGDLIAGNGLTKTGQTFNVVGTSGRIVANANSLDLDTAGSPGTYVSVTTDAYGRVTSGINYTITPNNTNNAIVQRDASGNFTANTMTGTASLALSISGGVTGSVVYQSGVSTTSLLAPGTSGQVLTSQGADLPPQWASASQASQPAAFSAF
jgi:hypothetical protein